MRDLEVLVIYSTLSTSTVQDCLAWMSFAYCRNDDRKRISGKVAFKWRCLDETNASAILWPKLLTFVQDPREICKSAQIGPFMFYLKSDFSTSVFLTSLSMCFNVGRQTLRQKGGGRRGSLPNWWYLQNRNLTLYVQLWPGLGFCFSDAVFLCPESTCSGAFTLKFLILTKASFLAWKSGFCSLWGSLLSGYKLVHDGGMLESGSTLNAAAVIEPHQASPAFKLLMSLNYL